MAATKQDILMFKKQLSKEDNTPERILDILEQVGTLKITLDLLKGTKIGKKIGRLRNSKNEKIAAAAKTIVSNWKKIASAATTNKKIEKDNNNNNNNGNETNNNNNNTVATKETIASSTTTTTTTTTDGDSSSKSNDNDKVSNAPATDDGTKVENKPVVSYAYEHKANPMRINACKALLRNIMRGADAKKYGGESFPAKEDVALIVDGIEVSLYDKFKNPSAYQSQLRSRLSNLRTNEKLRYEVATLTIQPIAFVSMSAQEMASDEKRKKIQADLAEQAEAARSDWALANLDKLQEQAGVSQDSVSMYRCPACRSEKVSSFAMQTRSADEPMTVFCTCLNPKCGKKFRR